MTLLVGYVAALLVIGVLDALWLGWLARGFYQREIGPLLLARFNTAPALLFYLGYPVGLVLLALTPPPETLVLALGRAALLGLLAYGTYDLTNLATLKHWSLRLSVVDIAWGTLVTAAAGGAAWLAMRAMPA